LPGSDLSQVEGATIIHSGGQDHTAGVAVVLQPPFNKALVSWRSVSSRPLHARLSHRHGHVSVVVAYAPTEGSPDPDKDQFYHQLSSVVQSISSHDELILLGDFNAVTGPRAQGFENVVGHFGFGTPNDNSARLLSFCSSHGLVIPGSWFQRLNIHRWSWISNDGSAKKELDHIITRHIKVDDIHSALEVFETTASQLGLHVSWQKMKIQNLGAGESAGMYLAYQFAATRWKK